MIGLLFFVFVINVFSVTTSAEMEFDDRPYLISDNLNVYLKKEKEAIL
ncbi:MAG: hypothetical protein K2K50_00400 [Anaeroplasmataceae bacterium]|nr:hypothetical protein [Anaeroplasmataceae bacterium]